eukprot:1352486-Amphidinium_carterae.2
MSGALKWCWVLYKRGQFGVGSNFSVGDVPSEVGDLLPTVDLGDGRVAEQLDQSGASATIALLTTGRMMCWGECPHSCYGDSTDKGEIAASMGDNLPLLDLGT